MFTIKYLTVFICRIRFRSDSFNSFFMVESGKISFSASNDGDIKRRPSNGGVLNRCCDDELVVLRRLRWGDVMLFIVDIDESLFLGVIGE